MNLRDILHAACCTFGLVLFQFAGQAETFGSVTIVPAEKASDVEARYIGLLKERIPAQDGGRVTVSVTQPGTTLPETGLVLVVGQPTSHALLADLLKQRRLAPPTDENPGPEGFLLDVRRDGDACVALAAGADQRGVLYAIGEVLRHMESTGDAVDFPASFSLRTAPAFEIRGAEPRQGETVRQLTGSREWTDDEKRAYLLDFALAGGNTFAYEYELPASFGLKTLAGHTPNAGAGPPEWQAMEAIGRTGYLCPSVPEARAELLRLCEEKFRNAPQWDYVRMNSGDGGGCECDQCAPFGGTFIRLAADMAGIIHKYIPGAKIFCTNQKLDNAGEEAIFTYLNEAPRDWLAAICYGPGSNAMSFQPGRRQDHRMDLFRYPSFGEYDRYLREMLHRLPRQQDIVFFTDVTHWIYSEYGLIDSPFPPDRNHETPSHWSNGIYEKKADPALLRIYDRRTFHVRPRNYYQAFQETMRYGIGDVTYSEGQHDHFNQWMWQRLLWNPHRTLEDIVSEYARVFFGRDAAPAMTEAIFQTELNYSEPLATNDGIDRLVALLNDAAARMPDHIMKDSVLWRQFMQKALIDKYAQSKLRRQLALEADVMGLLEKADAGQIGARESAAQAEALFAADVETEDMKDLRAQAERLGKETDRLFGVRSEGWFHLDRDLVDLDWLRAKVKEAATAPSEDAARAVASHVVHYEDPGEGGFYDDAGDPARSPHLVYGFPRSAPARDFRPSQVSMAYTTDETKGVTFRYDNLEKDASYRIRFTLARWVQPQQPGRKARPEPQKTESIYADGVALAKDLELPTNTPGFFEFAIPNELTRDGQLEVWFEKEPGIGSGTPSELTIWRVAGGWGTACNEAWLIKEPTPKVSDSTPDTGR